MRLNTQNLFTSFGLVFWVLLPGTPASAQSRASTFERHDFESRAALEAQAKEAVSRGDSAEAFLIHYRLQEGDFREGDRVIVKVQGTGGFSDTLVVRSGMVLALPQMGDLPLEGVLRSEINPLLKAHVEKYLRDPVVQATPLVRLGVLGSVGRPGFYYTAADLPLTDVLMEAGGPTSEADVGKISIRRQGDVIIDPENSRVALAKGMSLDMMHLEAGDQIEVGRQRHFNWQVIIPSATAALGLIITLTQLRH
jgi:protein involved in polysaccharide export with SLBB domain